MAGDDDDKTEIELDGLEQLSRLFKKAPPVVNIGILGNGGQRAAGQLTNAQIGAFHEHGTSRMERRSFLRVPLINELNKQLAGSGVITKRAIDEAIAANSLVPLMRKIAVVAEGVVLGAFDTNGYGMWAPLKPSTIAHKKNHQTLVETQQLRNSITSEVTEGEGEE